MMNYFSDKTGCHTVYPQENAHVERYHPTKDEEFYIRQLLSILSNKDFFLEAMNYLIPTMSLEKILPFKDVPFGNILLLLFLI